MSDETVKQLLSRIDTIAAKLGVTAQQVWGLLLVQARIEILTNIMLLAAISVIWFFGVRFVREHAGEFDYEPAVFGVGVALFFSGIIALVLLTQIPTLVFNPEYWALRQIVGR